MKKEGHQTPRGRDILDIKGKWKTALGQETAPVPQPA